MTAPFSWGRRTLGGLLLGWGILSPGAAAQEKPPPPPREVTMPGDTSGSRGTSGLPRISLPEFQITGREQPDLPPSARFPGPHPGGHERALQGPGPGSPHPLGAETGQGVRERVSFRSSPAGLRVRLRAGYGSYVTPFLDGWFAGNTDRTAFLMHAGYRSSEGFRAHTGFREGEGGFSG
ncbi:MAG: hypothetical protein WB626_11755, partial [Bacteroidota bacterium]